MEKVECECRVRALWLDLYSVGSGDPGDRALCGDVRSRWRYGLVLLLRGNARSAIAGLMGAYLAFFKICFREVTNDLGHLNRSAVSLGQAQLIGVKGRSLIT